MRRFLWVVALAGGLLARDAWGQQRPAVLGSAAGLVEEAAPPALSDAAWQEFRGKVIVSDVLLASQFGSDQVKINSLNRVQRTAVTGAEGFWRLHFIAFLDRPIGGDTVNLTAYETGDKTRRAVKTFEVPVPPGSKELHLNNFVVSEGMGFRRGQSYDLVVEPADKVNGKQDVVARGVITLR